MKERLLLSLAICGVCVLILGAGCRHLEPAVEDPAAVEEVVEASLEPVIDLYEQEQFDQALVAWIDATQGVPPTPTALDLRTRILAALRDEQARQGVVDRKASTEAMGVEAVLNEALPPSYGAVRYERRSIRSHVSPDSPMRKVLDRKVSIHLVDAALPAILGVLGADDNINIVADRGLGGGKKLDMQLDDVPLSELLDYVSRNYGIKFYVGENLIWATPAAAKQAGPLETRIYKLHKGVQFHTTDWHVLAGPQKKAGPNPVNRTDLSFMATELPARTTYIEELIARFVPKVAGAELLFDKNTHTLFVRNTLGNLALVEEIIEAVDVSPPQVLIEARFVEASVDDLQEIGIDWVLDEPWTMSRKQVISGGVPENQVAAQLTGAGAGGLAFSGPDRPINAAAGDPSLEDHGLNLTYQGILTQPMFTAVLHALEVSGKGRTLSVPRVTTVNNNPAKLRHGQDLLYYEQFQAQAFSLLDDNGKKYSVTALMPKGAPVLAELGFTLVAVPSVGGDGSSVSLLLTPTISKLDDFNYYTRANDSSNSLQQVSVKLPTISRREVQTKVVVQSGETVVMGGLIEVVSSDVEHRIPLLGHLPIIGQLFRRKDTIEQRRNLIIFVTATVISERGESLVQGSGPGEAYP
jgi:Flp pilus assembly secretin CpaC